MKPALIRIADNLTFDAVEYASRANAILGIRDSGKTYTATAIAEGLLDARVPPNDQRIPIFAFDPIGRWRFLRQPGKHGGHGYPIVVAGGAAPDLPLTPDNAPKLIRAAMQGGVSMVIDLYSVRMSKADWRAIVRTSFETILYESEGHGLRHVFLEEAAEFVPQRIYDGMTYAAVEKLARMGGNVGVGVTLINQRAEEVNKAVLELCDNLLLHRQRGKNSLASLGKWLGVANVKPPKQITDSLADLPTGQCWAWFKDSGRPRLIKVNRKNSFDPNRRELARHGATTRAPASVDVSEFVARMKAALEGKPIKPVVPIAEKPKPIPVPAKQESQVDEKEARALRSANTDLTRQVEQLTAEVRRLKAPRADPPNEGTGGQRDAGPLDIDSIIAALQERAPALLKVFAERPEIEVTVQRAVIRMDTTKQPGFLAAMIAQGFFDEAIGNADIKRELTRRGRSVHDANLSRDLSKLAEQGFLTREGTGSWKAVSGMKVSIVEAEAA